MLILRLSVLILLLIQPSMLWVTQIQQSVTRKFLLMFIFLNINLAPKMEMVIIGRRGSLMAHMYIIGLILTLMVICVNNLIYKILLEVGVLIVFREVFLTMTHSKVLKQPILFH